MRTRDNRPRVFVSSTVIDFGDLRSALRWWLEDMGYDAQLSEHAAFDKPLDTDSYTACLKAVEDTDYFVLLIGGRRGGLVSETDRISITRAEYRRAYEHFIKERKRPQIITFIRADVWTAYQDRRGLKTALDADDVKVLPEEVRARIRHHPSTVLDDPEHIFDFIDEVKRRDEIKEAQAKGLPWPPGNWVHGFAGFEDIVSVLRTHLRVGRIRRESVAGTLRAELTAILRSCLTTGRNDRIVPKHESVTKFRTKLTSGDPLAPVTLVSGELIMLGLFLLFSTSSSSAIDESQLNAAIAGGEFLEWNAERSAFMPTVIHKALVRLRAEMLQLRRACEMKIEGETTHVASWLERWKRNPSDKSWSADVAGPTRMRAASIHDRQSNIVDLCVALAAALDGSEAALRNLQLWSAFAVRGVKHAFLPGDGRQDAAVDSWTRDRVNAIIAAPALAPDTEEEDPID